MSKRKKLTRKLDKLWRTKGKERAKCEICQTLHYTKRPRYKQLHAHHIIGRGHKATRWDLRNRIWVCPTHHTLGPQKDCVEYNLGGWFLNWESDGDWMGKNRKDDKEHLRNLHKATKKWTLDELTEIETALKAE